MAPADPGGPGGSRGVGADPSRAAPPVTRQAGLAVASFVLAALLLALLAGAGSATAPTGTFNTTNDTNDTTTPEVGDLTKVGYTQVNLTITDDGDVDEATIDAADVFVSEGTIANLTATDAGSNATVTIQLESRLDTDRLGVAVAESATISDTAGNSLDNSGDVWRYVTGMDGVAPHIKLYEVDNGSGDRIDVRLRTSEDLGETYVRLYGPADRWLTLENFTKPSGIAEYEASVEPSATGSYRVTVVNATDHFGNTKESSRYEHVFVDVVPPTAVAGIDFAASEGRTIVFDANQSSDDRGIVNLTWDFGDGFTATAWQPTHTFERGNYTVTLRVTDAVGNVGRDELVLNLTAANASAALVGDAGSAARISDAGGASALVTLPDARAGDPVEISRRSGEPLAGTAGISLDSLTLTLATNDSASLGIEATNGAPVDDVVDAGASEPLGGLTIVHDVPDSSVDSARFRFGVADERLADAGVAPETIRLYRYHEGQWTRLSTTHLNETDGRHLYRATAPGLSRFAIAPASAESTQTTPTPAPATATPTPVPEAKVLVTNATLNRTSVPVGEAVRVTATVSNDGGAAASYTAGLTVDGVTEATRSVSVPGGGERSVAFVYRPTANGTLALAVNGTAAGTLEVGGGGGGSLLGFLGFIPFGLIQGLVTYLGGTVAAVFLLLKAAALYLGY